MALRWQKLGVLTKALVISKVLLVHLIHDSLIRI